jgi:hypothetical protein
MATTYEPIATNTLSSAVASVTFSSISSAYTDLVLVVNGTSASAGDFSLQVGNGSIDTGTNYSMTALYGNGSTATSARSSTTSAVSSTSTSPTTTSARRSTMATRLQRQLLHKPRLQQRVRRQRRH